MPSINTLRTVTVRYQSEGADKVRSDADAVAAAQTRMGAAAEAASVTTETASRRTLSAAGSFDRLRASVDAQFRAQQQMERALNLANRAFQQGATDASTYERTLSL
ncbi:hypothetical protein ACFQE0_27330, partial [Methylobacterium komagatae]